MEPTKKKKEFFNFYWIYGALAILFIASYFWNTGNSEIKEINSNELDQMLVKGHIEKILIIRKKEQAQIFIKKDSLKSDPKYKDLINSKSDKAEEGPHFYHVIGSADALKLDIDKAEDKAIRNDTIGKPEEVKQQIVKNYKKVIVAYDNSKDWGMEVFGWLLPIIIIVIIWIFIMRSMNKGGPGGGQIFNFGKSKAQLFDKNTAVSVSFKDVAGLEGAKEEIIEIVDF